MLCFVFCLHISIGAKKIPLTNIIDALLYFDDNNFEHIIIWEMRLPRALVAVVVGASLAVAGALTQAITRNPLASPGILGIMHGSSFAVVLIVSLFTISYQYIPLFAGIGALLAAILILFLTTMIGINSPMTLILIGSAITAFLSSLISVIKILNVEVFEHLRIWLTGSLSGSEIYLLYWCLPWIIIGIIIALSISSQITCFAMGEETAIGLGIKITRLKILALSSIILLSASSVSLVGPIGFIGLVIPHIVRILYGYDYKQILPYSTLIGAIYLLIVDILARTLISPQEITTGLISAILGAPVFIYLVRKKL